LVIVFKSQAARLKDEMVKIFRITTIFCGKENRLKEAQLWSFQTGILSLPAASWQALGKPKLESGRNGTSPKPNYISLKSIFHTWNSLVNSIWPQFFLFLRSCQIKTYM
jgi:hypothetical protein